MSAAGRSGLDDFFADLAREGGATEASGLSFTLESARAREKLAEFALVNPENYQLLAVSGLYALGSRHFAVSIDADDFILQGDRPLDRAPFQDLWSFVSRGSGDNLVTGCRLIAMSMLTSVRLESLLWKVESVDAEGAWEFALAVRRGQLGEQAVRPSSHPETGIRLWAKRKHLGQVARRYLSRMIKSHSCSDESLIRQRLFLPRGASLSINGEPELLGAPSAQNVLAVLETGDAPTLIQGPPVHRLERDYAMSILLCDPESDQDSTLPGLPNHVQWIWNGLSMDQTVLGGELACFRAFVWAAELRPDLSFGSLVDNRDKQALERNVRSMARELLDRYVRDLSSQMAATLPDPAPFASRLSLIRRAIVERIDLRRDPARLASLNRALIDCPLVLGSGPDGLRRWVCFREIWKTLSDGRPLAAFDGSPFPDGPTFPEVPPWPDRPLVLYTSKAEHEFLRKRFPQAEISSGREVLEQIRRLSPAASATVEDLPDRESSFGGSAVVEGREIRWSLAPSGGREQAPAVWSGLRVRTPAGQVFHDTTLQLPRGLQARVEADWSPTYEGTLASPELRGKVRDALLAGCARQLGQRRGLPTEEDYALLASLLASLSESPTTTEAWLSWEWLLVKPLRGELRRASPQWLRAELERWRAPLYALPWEALSWPASPGQAEKWSGLPIVLAPDSCHAGLSGALGQAVQKANGLALLLSRSTPAWPGSEPMLWHSSLEGEDCARLGSPRLRAFRMGVFARKAGVHRKARLSSAIAGHSLGESKMPWFLPYLRLAVDWEDGWPDTLATQRLGYPQGEADAVMRKACLRLGERLLREAPASVLMQVHPDLIGTLTFDLLSEPESADLPLLLTGSGQKIRLADVPSLNGQAIYFDTPEPFHPERASEIYLPEPLREGMALLNSLKWVRSLPDTPSPKVERHSQQEVALDKPFLPTGQEGGSRKEALRPVRQAPSPSAEPARHPVPEPARPPVSAPTPQPLSAPPPQRATTEPPAAPVDNPGLLKPDVPSLPAPGDPPEILAAVLDGADAVRAELRSRFGHGEIPHQELFETFLAHLRYEPENPKTLSLERDQPILGRACRKAIETSDGRAQLLSALYSLFNRRHDNVADPDERVFHRALVCSFLDPSPKRSAD